MNTMHQIAKYLSDPSQLHGKTILYLVCYLKKTRNSSATLMQISQEIGTSYSHLLIPVPASHKVDG